jgi:hypothetical protein
MFKKEDIMISPKRLARIAVISKRSLPIVLAAIVTVVSAAHVAAEEPTNQLHPLKSIMSLSTGYATDGQSGRGIVGTVKNMSFFGGSDFYWGFDSIFGSFISTGQAITETGGFIGYCRSIPGTNLGFSKPYSSDLGLQVSFAPVVRPYNLQTGKWDFSGSYFIFSLSADVRSFAKVLPGHWVDRNKQ